MTSEKNMSDIGQVYLKAKTIDEAIRLASEHENDFRFLAGGTDVIVNKFQNNDESNCLIDITGIEELKKISPVHPEGNAVATLMIGSLVTLDELKNNSEIKKHFPALVEAAHSVASPMLRKTATIGGNILCENRCSFFNQSEWWREAVGYCLKCDGEVCIATGGKKACFSKFVSDTAPVLISMDAMIEIAASSPDPFSKGEGELVQTSIIPLESIYTGDGIAPRNLSKTSIIKNIILPLDENFKTVYKKLRPREAVDFSSLTTVVTIDDSGNIKIVLGGVDPKPVVVTGTIHDDKEKLIKEAVKKSRIVDNDFYSRTYRKEMISVFLKQSFEELTAMK